MTGADKPKRDANKETANAKEYGNRYGYGYVC